jgi:hypothetical protein
MHIKIPTMEEIHKIAYVTQKGWACYGEIWSKEGVILELLDCRGDRHPHQYVYLDDAYNYETDQAEALATKT